MSSGVSSNSSSNPMDQYQAWQKALEMLETNVKDMEEKVSNDVALIDKLQSEKSGLESNASSLEQQIARLQAKIAASKGKTPKTLTSEMNALKGELACIDAQIGELGEQIDQVNSQLSEDKESLAQSQKKLSDFNSTSASNAMLNQSVNQTINQTTEEVSLQSQKQENAETERKNALDAIQSEIQLEMATAQDAILRIGNIKKDNEQIDQDKAKITELKHEITECAIKLAAASAAAYACLGFNPAADAAVGYYTYQMVKLNHELGSVKDDLKNTENDLKTQEADLKVDMSKLEMLSLGDLNKLIDSLFKEIGKLVNILGKGGKASQGSMQEASEIIAEVMAIVEMITSKVHQMRSEDQQWMGRASAANSEVQAAQSKINMQSLAKLEQYAHFMKAVMTAVQVVADVAAVTIAVASGGTLAITMAVLMVALTASGALNKATKTLAKAMSKNGATWAKAVADVVVAIAMMVVTMGTSAVAEGVEQTVTEVSEEVEEEVSEMIETDVMNVLKNGLGKLASSIEDTAELGETGETALKGSFQKLNEAMSKFKDSAIKLLSKAGSQFKENMTNAKAVLGQSTADWGAANGLTDATKSIYADATGQANVAADKVKMAQWMEILQIITEIVQAVIQMVSVYYGTGANSSETSLMERIFGKMSKMSAVNSAAVGTELLAQGVGAYAQTGLMTNSLYKSELTKHMGKNQSELAYLKATGEQRKMFEKKQIELFASQMEQQIAALYTQVKKNGEAEREAAMVLQQSAV